MKLSFSQKNFSFFISGFVVFGLVSGFQFHHVLKDFKKNASESIFSETKALDHAIASQFYERVGDAEAFSFNPVLLQNDRARISDTLDSYSASYGIYDMIVVLDTDGNVVATNHKSPAGKKLAFEGVTFPDFKNEGWYQELLKDGKSIVTEPKGEEWIQKLYGEKRNTNVFARLVKDSWGRPYRVIANFANTKWINAEIQSFNGRMVEDGHQGVRTYLYSGKGALMVGLHGNGEFLKVDDVRDQEFAQKEFEPASRLVRGENGVMEYRFGGKGETLVTSYVSLHDPKFESKMGWGVAVQVPESELMGNLGNSVFRFYGALFFCIFGLGLMGYFFSRKLGSRMTDSIDNMNKALVSNRDTGNTLVKASQDLEDASAKQSSAIQESMSALAEMASMISQTAENAKLSQESTLEVSERSVGGRQIMDKMSGSMVAIEQANQSLQEISKSIESISQKTNVINDIVFKTQLLSFNASIEAARAGQYGKGFAVVAEEVGNLAQMSGNAAREIETLILDSERKVGTTLDLIRRRVNEGNVVTDEAVRTFNGISSAIDSLREQVKLIAEACVQQDVGIQQTNKAMEQLDMAARQTLDAAQMTRASSDELQSSGDHLGLVSNDLVKFVHGEHRERVGQSSSVGEFFSKFARKNQRDEHVEPKFSFGPDEQQTAEPAVAVAAVAGVEKPFNFDDLVVNAPQLENIDLSKVSPDDESFKKIAS